MGPLRLILREIRQGRRGFVLGVLAVAVAVGCAVGTLGALAGHDRRAEQLLAGRRAEVGDLMRHLQLDLRGIAREMGYNLIILPREQTLENLHADRPLPRYMPEAWADTLAARGPTTVHHLAPVLQQRILWPEYNRPVLLTGLRGERNLGPFAEKPLRRAVGPGEMVVGYGLHSDPKLRLGVGQRVRFFGQEYTIAALRAQEGGPDDMGVWIDLRAAQEIFRQPGQITGILALQAESMEGASAAAREVQAILPETQVMEFAVLARARSTALALIDQAARQSGEREQAFQAGLRDGRMRTGRVVAGVAIAAAIAWIILLTLFDARGRGLEISRLRALGVAPRQMPGIILGRTALMALAGAVVGCLAGAAVGGLGQGWVVRGAWLAVAIVGAPALACLAAALPTLRAIGRETGEEVRT